VTIKDPTWATERLAQFQAAVAAVIETGQALLIDNGVSSEYYRRVRDDAVRQESTARRIMSEVLTSVPEWQLGTDDGNQLAKDLATRAISIIADEEEVNEHLGRPGPKMEAASLHPVVWNAAAALWGNGHHDQAVQAAARFVNAHVQGLTQRSDVSDSALMQETFSSDEAKPDRPRLRWPGDPRDLTVRAMNDGLRGYAPGVFMAIRNPATHSIGGLEAQAALEQLAALSVLMRWIDGCAVVTAGD
jgi:hypothetical protein